jgi:hypothetical protein
MSGGTFDYNQYKIREIAAHIQTVIENNGRKKTPSELKEYGYRDADWYEKYPEDLYHYKYPDEVVEKFKDAVKILDKAAVYAQRVDYLLAGDDGEESFLRRLEEELLKLE